MKLRITVDGRSYEVDVEIMDESTATAGALSPTAGSPTATVDRAPPPPPMSVAQPTVALSDMNKCVSPLPGTVLRINIEPGDTVKRNQTLMILDAMKMETSIPSPREGRIKVIHVDVGASVKQGDVLIEFE